MNSTEITYQIKCRYYGDAKSRRTVFKLGPEVRNLFKTGERVRFCERGSRLYIKKVEDPESTEGYAVGVKFDIQVCGPIGQELRKFEGEYDIHFDSVREQHYIDRQESRPLSFIGKPNHGRSINMPLTKTQVPKGGQKNIIEEDLNDTKKVIQETVQSIIVAEVPAKLDAAALWCLKNDIVEDAKILAKASEIYENFIKLAKGDK